MKGKNMKKADKKLSMEEMIEKLDAAKKANPLDLSSDQDLSIALMNLVSLEEHFFALDDFLELEYQKQFQEKQIVKKRGLRYGKR